MILKILKHPDKSLRLISNQVTAAVETAIPKLVADMFETMYDGRGVGLSAIQVGETLRLFVMEVTGRETVIINPRIIETVGEPVLVQEGCLSLPGIFERVYRAPGVLVEYDDWRPSSGAYSAENVDRVTNLFTGLEAQVVQHENEHLDGGLMLDKFSGIKRDRIVKKMQKVR